MKKYLAFLIIFAFVTVQFVDIVIFDVGHAGASEIGTKPDPHKEKPESCAIHCGCHLFHHMGPSGQASDLGLAFGTGRKQPVDSLILSNLSQGPPVPPPLV